MWNSARDYLAKTLAENPETELLPLLMGYENAIKEAATHFLRVLKTSGKGANFTWESVQKEKSSLHYSGEGE